MARKKADSVSPQRRPRREGPNPGEQRGARRRRDAATLLGHAGTAGADDALRALVNQFADPLSFLRELVQNSLDAASTRIEVDFSFEEGMACVAVADNGEGMNELVIDRYLLTLFASSKENDLTKIGKFGIGFVSIFAIQPDLVVLETGQTGEAWRLIFHADTHYEKLRLAEPVEGTVVRLHKRMDRPAFDELRAKGRKTVAYWCKYAEAEILVDGEQVGEPFGLDAALAVRFAEPGTEIVVGFAAGEAQRVVGFYNRGLTLVEGAQLTGAERFFDGLSLRVKSRYLEHTLTRDNVLQDDNYEKAIALVRRVVERELRPALYARLRELARSSTQVLEQEQCFRFAALPSMSLAEHGLDEPVFSMIEAEPASLRALRRIRTPVGSLLAAGAAGPVTRLLAGEGIAVLLACPGPMAYLEGRLSVAVANVCYCTALAPSEEEAALARPLCEAVARLLDGAGLRVRRVVLGDLDYDGSPVAGHLHIRQQAAYGLTRIGHDDRATLLGGARELVLDRAHSLVRQALAIAGADVALAAHLVAQAVSVLHGEGEERAGKLAGLALEIEGSRG